MLGEVEEGISAQREGHLSTVTERSHTFFDLPSGDLFDFPIPSWPMTQLQFQCLVWQVILYPFNLSSVFQIHVFLNMRATWHHVSQPRGHQLWTCTPIQGKYKWYHQFGDHLCSGLLFLPLHLKVSQQFRQGVSERRQLCHPIVTERVCHSPMHMCVSELHKSICAYVHPSN